MVYSKVKSMSKSKVPFLSIFINSIVSVMLPYECPVFNMWLKYPDLLLLSFMSLICSLYLVLNGRPVCPIYFIEQLMHFNWHTPFFSYLSVCVYGFNMFCTVFFVLNAIFICVFLKSCGSFLVCFP
jgi:hypothetical protein